jgi:two-component system sensor histidine kinase TctE
VAARTPSLRRGLFAWLIVPVVALALVSAMAAYVTAYRFANQVYDRWISDTAVALSRLVRVDDGRVRLDLPPEAQQMLDSDQRDRIYFKVIASGGAFVAGHRGLGGAPRTVVPGKDPLCFDATLQGAPVRSAVYVPPAGGFSVEIAETVNKRDTLALEIIASMLLPLLAVIALAAAGIWIGVARGLRPLTALAAEIGGRSGQDLRPVNEAATPIEVRPLMHSLNGLLARLDAALATQRRFVADAAHQLRTPLTGLKTQAELALRSTDPAAVRESVQRILESTDRTSRLVNQLLSLARAEPEGQTTSRRERIDLARLMRAVTADWIPRALENGIDLGFAGDAPAWVEGDATLLRELAGNLIENALRYCPRGSEITVAASRQPQSVELTVTDDGPGVPAAERERVFERFHRVLGSRAAGSGLGLAIVKQIAEGHGAAVELAAGPRGVGTRVCIAFPAVP